MKRAAREEGNLSDEIFRKSANNDFKAVTKIHDDLVSGATKTAQGNYKLPAFYSGMLYCPKSNSDCSAMLERWRKEDANSPIIVVAEAMLEYKLASSPATDTSKDVAVAKTESEAHAAKGWELAQKALSNPNVDPETYSVAMNLAFMQPDKDTQVKDLIEKLSDKYPNYQPFWMTTLQNLISAERFSEIPTTLDSAAKANSANGGDTAYASLASFVSKKITLEKYKEVNLAWPTIRKGFQEIHAKFPTAKDPRADYLILAVKVVDREAGIPRSLSQR